MYINTNCGLDLAVCFSKDRYHMSIGIILKRAKHSNDDILITDFPQITSFL